MILGDFHIHSQFSDGKLSIKELVDLYGRQGFGAIAITDHLCETGTFYGVVAKGLRRTLNAKTFPEYIGTIRCEAERAKSMYGMTVIPGFEITKNEIIYGRSAHFLALGVTEFIDPNLPIIDILTKIKDLGGISIAAHPVSTRKMEAQTYHLWENKAEYSNYFDA